MVLILNENQEIMPWREYVDSPSYEEEVWSYARVEWKSWFLFMWQIKILSRYLCSLESSSSQVISAILMFLEGSSEQTSTQVPPGSWQQWQRDTTHSKKQEDGQSYLLSPALTLVILRSEDSILFGLVSIQSVWLSYWVSAPWAVPPGAQGAELLVFCSQHRRLTLRAAGAVLLPWVSCT